MALEFKRIVLRKGVETELPTDLLPGELAFTTDTKRLFIGTNTGNKEINVGDVVTSINGESGAITIPENFVTSVNGESGDVTVSQVFSVEDLENVAVSGIQNGQVLKWNGTNWVNDFDIDTIDSSNFYLTSVDASNLSSVSFVQTGVASNVTANFTHTHTKSDITDFTHTHTEVDITDLDKYTQAQTDTLLDAKVEQTDYDEHKHLTARYFLGSVSSEDLPNAVNYTMTVNIFNNTILLYNTQNPTTGDAAANVGTLWLNIQTGSVHRMDEVVSVAPANYTWTQVGSVISWPSITAINADTYYGFNSTYWSLQDGANPSQGTFLNVPDINALQTTISKNDIALLMIKYRYYDSVADRNIDQIFTTHPTFIGYEDINDVYSIPAYNTGFIRISSQFLTGGVYNITIPTPVDANDIQQILFYGVKTTPVTVTGLQSF